MPENEPIVQVVTPGFLVDKWVKIIKTHIPLDFDERTRTFMGQFLDSEGEMVKGLCTKGLNKELNEFQNQFLFDFLYDSVKVTGVLPKPYIQEGEEKWIEINDERLLILATYINSL